VATTGIQCEASNVTFRHANNSYTKLTNPGRETVAFSRISCSNREGSLFPAHAYFPHFVRERWGLKSTCQSRIVVCDAFSWTKFCYLVCCCVTYGFIGFLTKHGSKTIRSTCLSTQYFLTCWHNELLLKLSRGALHRMS